MGRGAGQSAGARHRSGTRKRLRAGVEARQLDQQSDSPLSGDETELRVALSARLKLLLALGIVPCSTASPAPAAIPSSAGTVWQYEVSEAIGERGAGTILLRIGGPEADRKSVV